MDLSDAKKLVAFRQRIEMAGGRVNHAYHDDDDFLLSLNDCPFDSEYITWEGELCESRMTGIVEWLDQKDRIKALEAERKQYRALIDSLEEVKGDLKAERDRLRAALKDALDNWEAWMDDVEEGNYAPPNKDDRDAYADAKRALEPPS